MSRSNPTLTNPAEHFFDWSGSKGAFQFYDKASEKNIKLQLPFEFLVLDQLTTITGYNKQLESGFWSNEVRNVTTDMLFVKTKKGPFEAGLYGQLAQTRSKGGKYAKSIYIAYKRRGEWAIANFKAHGSALSAWIEFTNSVQRGALDTGKVIMDRGDKQESPVGDFYPPTFELQKASDAENERAIKLDRELQIYLNQYLAAPKGDEAVDGAGDEPIDEDLGKATPEQQADFDSRKAAGPKSRSQAADGDPGPQAPPKEDVVIEDFGDEPINLDDIPF